MVSSEVISAWPLQPAPEMFCEDAIIRRASSSTVCACVSNRPAIARIECGSVIKRVAMLAVSLVTEFQLLAMAGSATRWRTRRPETHDQSPRPASRRFYRGMKVDGGHCFAPGREARNHRLVRGCHGSHVGG